MYEKQLGCRREALAAIGLDAAAGGGPRTRSTRGARRAPAREAVRPDAPRPPEDPCRTVLVTGGEGLSGWCVVAWKRGYAVAHNGAGLSKMRRSSRICTRRCMRRSGGAPLTFFAADLTKDRLAVRRGLRIRAARRSLGRQLANGQTTSWSRRTRWNAPSMNAATAAGYAL